MSFDPTEFAVNGLIVRVYRAMLDRACEGDADKQFSKDNDGGKKQEARAQFYRPVVLETLYQAGVLPRPVRVAPKRKEPADVV